MSSQKQLNDVVAEPSRLDIHHRDVIRSLLDQKTGVLLMNRYFRAVNLCLTYTDLS